MSFLQSRENGQDNNDDSDCEFPPATALQLPTHSAELPPAETADEGEDEDEEETAPPETDDEVVDPVNYLHVNMCDSPDEFFSK